MPTSFQKKQRVASSSLHYRLAITAFPRKACISQAHLNPQAQEGLNEPNPPIFFIST